MAPVALPVAPVVSGMEAMLVASAVPAAMVVVVVAVWDCPGLISMSSFAEYPDR